MSPARVPLEKEKVNILLVDDQPAKLLSYEAILEPLGENLILASSGTEALEQLLRNEIAVILVDVCMPDLDGFELASMIRQHPRHQRTAIVFVSAIHLSDIDRLRGYECGAVDYVSVPIVPEILQARVSVFADLYRKTQQLERLNRELESRVAARTSELEASTERLRESEEALRETDRRKDEFLAMLSHELRNPLAPIRNAVEVLGLTSKGDSNLDWCRGVLDRQVGQLTRLVDDLLDVSRITRGKLEIRKEPVDLLEIIRGAVEAVRRQIEGKDQTLRAELGPGQVPLLADPVRVRQIVLNLLDNASKFTPEGGAIVVGVGVDPDATCATIRITDTGLGIPNEEIPRLFQMFHQAHPPLNGAQGGLGIGLALVRLLVELHGGTVEAQSDGPGRGTEFTIRLPIETAGEQNRSAHSEPGFPRRDASAMKRRILVVDDNEDSAESLARYLRMSGHAVETANDGPSALHAAEQFRPEAILLDIGMPGLDGYAVARKIREEPWGRGILLVALTGWGQAEDRRRSWEAGFDGHLVKPVRPENLDRLLQAAPTTESAITPSAEPA